jgi:hypothetical protein
MVDDSLTPELKVLGLVRVHEEKLVLLARDLELARVVTGPCGLARIEPLALAVRMSSRRDEWVGPTIEWRSRDTMSSWLPMGMTPW